MKLYTLYGWLCASVCVQGHKLNILFLFNDPSTTDTRHMRRQAMHPHNYRKFMIEMHLLR